MLNVESLQNCWLKIEQTLLWSAMGTGLANHCRKWPEWDKFCKIFMMNLIYELQTTIIDETVYRGYDGAFTLDKNNEMWGSSEPKATANKFCIARSSSGNSAELESCGNADGNWASAIICAYPLNGYSDLYPY